MKTTRFLIVLLGGATLLRSPVDGQTISSGGSSVVEQDFKKNVRAATTANITIATALNAGDTLDGLTLAAGDRVLVKNQSTASQNGIYKVGPTPARDSDANSYVELPGSLVVVGPGGTANKNKVFVCSAAETGTLGSTSVTYEEKGATGAGTGNALVEDPLSQFAATTSSQLKGVLSDELGDASGKAIFALGTLAIASGKTATINNTITWTGTDGTTMTLPTTTATLARTDAAQTLVGTQTLSSTTSLLLGTAGSAVGNIGFRNATSGTATLAPPTGALGTYTVTLPNAASTLAIASQQITWAGPTAARTYTLPDAAATLARTDAANTFTGASTASAWVLTSPTITTGIVPTTNDGAALGSTSNKFSDLWLATGAVIDFNSGDVTLTHGGNALTVAGGDLFVPAEAYDATNWDGDNSVPTKNDVRDKIETISAGALDIDALGSAAAGADLDADDKFVVSHDGTEKSITTAEVQEWIEGLSLTFATINTDDLVVTDSISTAGTINADVSVTTGSVITAGFAYQAGAEELTFAGSFSGSRIATWPDASTKIPISAQELTFTGPSAARTITLPDAAFTVARSDAAQTLVGTQTLSSTTSLLLGTAGSAVGNIGFRNATSGTATLAPPTGALGTYSVTLPNAASTLPIFGQQVTFAGPTAARTYTLPDAAATLARTDAANTFTGASTASAWVLTSPTITTGIVPTTNDGAALGSTSLGFSDLHLATGALINVANGNWVFTHSSGIGTVSTGDFRVTTAGTNSASVATVGGVQTLSGKTLSGPILEVGMQLAEEAVIIYDSVLSADGKATGTAIPGVAGATLAFGDLIYLDPTDSRWELVDANSAAAADGDGTGLIGLCLTANTDGNPINILLDGTIRADAAFPTLTVGAPVYISETAGDVVVTSPTTDNAVVRFLGYALDGNSMVFKPASTYIRYAP